MLRTVNYFKKCIIKNNHLLWNNFRATNLYLIKSHFNSYFYFKRFVIVVTLIDSSKIYYKTFFDWFKKKKKKIDHVFKKIKYISKVLT